MARDREKDAKIVGNLKRFMEETGWSVPIMAGAIGMTEGQLYKIFDGEGGAKPHLDRFAEALNRPMDDFLKDDPPKQKPIAPPVFMLRIRPKAEVDPEVLDRAKACIAAANKAQFERSRKR